MNRPKPVPMRATLAAAALAAGLALCLAPAAGRAAAAGDNGQPALEHDVKAAFVLQLLGFVEWPAATAPGDTITIGVVGRGSMNAALAALSGERSGPRVVTVRELADPAACGRCQVLFINGPDALRADAPWRAAAARGTLAVADQDGFAAGGGMVSLVVTGGRVGLEINPDAASRAGLKISSKVLRLARIVRGSG